MKAFFSSTLGANIATYLAYLIIGYGGIYFTVVSGGTQSLLWLGSGVSLSALIICGTRVWPAIFLGSLSAVGPFIVFLEPFDAWWKYPLLVPIPPLINVTVQSLFAYFLYRRFVGESGFNSTTSILNFIFIVIAIPTVVNSFLLSFFYSFAGLYPLESLTEFLRGWFMAGLGDIHGYFILTPLAITWVAMRNQITRQAPNYTSALLCALGFTVLIAASVYTGGPVVYLLLPLAVIVALNFGLQGASLYIFLMSFALTSATAQNLGPFVEASASDSLISLLMFVFSVGVPLLILASERNQVRIYQDSLESQVEDRTRELSRAVAAKDEFLATISHELRTPLHAILGVVRVLDKDSLSDYLQSRIGLIETAGESLLTQINGILAFIRFSNDASDLPSSNFNLHELAHTTAALMEDTAVNVGSDITTHIDADVPAEVSGSPEQLRQVLFNLLSNAVKYGPGTPIRLEIKTIADKLRFQVSDEGPGIPLEDQSQIFDKFTRINPDQTTAKGTGLGLALSKRLVEHMGGEIRVHSNGIQGTCIEFDMALAPPIEIEPEQIADTTDRRFSLLLLEDDPVASQVSEDFLTMRGHDVITAATANDALAALRTHDFDALLSDINLPDMSGQDLMRHIHSHPEQFGDLYVAALTASVLPAQEDEFLQNGFKQVLSKPLDQLQLTNFFSALARHKEQADTPPLINVDFVYSEIESIGDEMFARLTEAYGRNYAEHMRSLAAAIEQSDTDEQVNRLHLLASASSNLGLLAFQYECRQLEAELKTKGSVEIDLAELEHLNEESLKELQEVILTEFA